ncbi:NUDIX domain-containing protein [Psychrobacter sp. 72-O-c]|uniref:NUDIX domain-containing protein n=1 Tax=Psychrobacter sp. 72-O-c TaxID=2774125 RepID=UPI0019193402|nr:NUDIX domain-containing protein [Psychrobacter sp. 72-O-c]
MLNKVEEQQANNDDKSVVDKATIDKVVNHKSIVNVAVAVIHHQEQYLLGFRNSSQHQGNRYEFVGGKIDSHETASAALIREVSEETGIDIQSNHLVKLGRLHHDYGDKQVCLQVYKVALTAEQYKQHQHCDYGLEGQALTWATKSQLLAGDYPLPAANQTILAWLQLPTQMTVTYPLIHFSEDTDASNAWLAYHQQHISKNTWVYIRTKASELESKVASKTKVTDAELAAQLMHLRPDIYSVLPYANGYQHDSTDKILTKSETPENTPPAEISNQVVAVHLTHHELMCWFNGFQNDDSEDKSKGSQYDSSSRPLIVSCHDAESIHTANQFAATRLQHQKPPVIGIFLSPVLATQSHPDSEPLGWQAWSALAQLADMPVIGLGGLSPIMFEQADQYGAISIAGIRQFLQG